MKMVKMCFLVHLWICFALEPLLTCASCVAFGIGQQGSCRLYENINSKVRGMSARKKVVMSADVRAEGRKTGKVKLNKHLPLDSNWLLRNTSLFTV